MPMTVIPSTPGLPLLAFTCRNAAFRFSRSHTSSISRFVLAGFSVPLVAPDGSVTRDRVQRPRLSTTADLARRQPKLLAAFDLVPKKLESLPDMHDRRLLRMQLHAQFVQNPKRRGHCRPRLCCRLAGRYPVVGIPRERISLAPHLLIERRQKYIAEQG